MADVAAPVPLRGVAGDEWDWILADGEALPERNAPIAAVEAGLEWPERAVDEESGQRPVPMLTESGYFERRRLSCSGRTESDVRPKYGSGTGLELAALPPSNYYVSYVRIPLLQELGLLSPPHFHQFVPGQEFQKNDTKPHLRGRRCR